MFDNFVKLNKLFATMAFIVAICIAQINPILYIGAQTPTESTPEIIEEAPPEYVFNPVTGLWENGIYAWNPATGQTTPLKDVNYSYNPDTEQWDTTEWSYNPNTGTYSDQPVKKVIVENTGPSSTNTIIDPIDDTSITNTGPNSTQSANTGTIDKTGPNSTNKIDDDSKKSKFYNTYFDASISVSVDSFAKTGDASVLNNTIGGNATTGDASVYSSIINLLQSSWTAGGLSPSVFTRDILGNYYGDILIDPGLLKVNNEPSSNNTLEIKHVESASIENNLKLDATSGNATVSKNTSSGDATSGDANALAQVINMINSSIAAQQSFIGTLNVYGDLEGDVLLPENLKKQLLNSGIPSATVSLNGDTKIDNKTDILIEDNLNLIAQSGDALVKNNTIAGDAKSGNAQTDVTIFNLVNNQLSSDAGLLVFVNVAGEWIGFITGVDNGNNSGLLGVSEKSNAYSDTDIDVDRIYAISNNISLSATTGDAEVSSNTIAGDATTGNAYAKANLLNVINSNLNFTSWFGALFINIFGNWSGSFGTDTQFGGFSTNNQSGGIGGNPSTSNQVSDKTNQNTGVLGSGKVLVFALAKNPSNSSRQSYKIYPIQDIGTNGQTSNTDSNDVAAIASESTNPPFYSADEDNQQSFTIEIWQALIVLASILILAKIFYNNRQVSQA